MGDDLVWTTLPGQGQNFQFQNVTLTHGMKYFGFVKALDVVGHESAVARSSGATFDATPPKVRVTEVGGVKIPDAATTAQAHVADNTWNFAYAGGSHSVVLLCGPFSRLPVVFGGFDGNLREG